jgi:hypothetical protein
MDCSKHGILLQYRDIKSNNILLDEMMEAHVGTHVMA